MPWSSLDSQLHLPNSESPQDSNWVPPPCTRAWKLSYSSSWGDCRAYLVRFQSLRTTLLYFLACILLKTIIHSFICSIFFPASFFFFFRAAPTAYGGSQARGQIRAVAAGLRHSQSNARPKLGLRLTPQLMATPDP